MEAAWLYSLNQFPTRVSCRWEAGFYSDPSSVAPPTDLLQPGSTRSTPLVLSAPSSDCHHLAERKEKRVKKRELGSASEAQGPCSDGGTGMDSPV